MMENEIIYTGPVTGTLGEEVVFKRKGKNGNVREEFGVEFEPIQQNYRINPADESDYKGITGYKDAYY
jgi:hypothetical protein